MHHIHAPTPAPHSPFTQLLTTPSSCPSNPRPSNPQNPHLRQPLKYSTMKPHKTAAQMRASRAAVIRSRPQLCLLAAVAWSAPRALPWSLHGARNGTHLSPVTHTAQKSVSAHRNLGEGARESREQATEAPDVACFRTINSLTVFWWGSGPQMLPVQQPEWLFHGCQAMEAEAWGTRWCTMPLSIRKLKITTARQTGG